MKAFAELAAVKYIIAHAFFGEYDFKQHELYLICENGTQIGISLSAEEQLVYINIPQALVADYLQSDVNKEFPVLDYAINADGNLSAYIENIELDDVKFIQLLDNWANNSAKSVK